MVGAQAHRGPDGRGFAAWTLPRQPRPLRWASSEPDAAPPEWGHFRLGLGHNLASSADAFAYRPQYWQLRTSDGAVTAPCDGSESDGVRVDFADGWVHVRASNTQSLVRVIAEAGDPARAQELLDWARERLRI